MNTANGATTYLQSDFQREARSILKTEKFYRESKGRIKNVSWSIRVNRNGTTLLAQGFINGQIIESSLAL